VRKISRVVPFLEALYGSVVLPWHLILLDLKNLSVFWNYKL